MDRKPEETPAQKRTRAQNLATLRAVVAAYLVYLGGSMIADYFRGKATVSPILIWASGLVFIAAGLGFGYFIWKQWKAESAAAASAEDEPDSTEEE